MEYLKLFCLIAGGLFILDRIGLWMEKRGWLYYRHKKASGGGLGNALQEFNAFLNPSARHIIEVKKKDFKQRDDQEDDKDFPSTNGN